MGKLNNGLLFFTQTHRLTALLTRLHHTTETEAGTGCSLLSSHRENNIKNPQRRYFRHACKPEVGSGDIQILYSQQITSFKRKLITAWYIFLIFFIDILNGLPLEPRLSGRAVYTFLNFGILTNIGMKKQYEESITFKGSNKKHF